MLKHTTKHSKTHCSISDIQYIGWGLPEKEKTLKDILKNYFSRIKKNDKLEKIWNKYIRGISYMNYMMMIR